MTRPSPTSAPHADHERLALNWPGKGNLPRVRDNRWQLVAPDEMILYRPLLRRDTEGAPSIKFSAAVVIYGDLIDALDALRPAARGTVDFVYHEAHRVDFLEKECADPAYRHSLWLSIIRECSARARYTLKKNGFYALQVDDSSYHYARLCLDEEFGASNYVCTIVWQKKYGPQNDLNVPTAAQEYVIIYSTTPAADLPVMGFKINDDLTDDGDPRGPWTAGHKGAKSGSEDAKFEVNAPPYRWEITSGDVPPGAWRLNRWSGVIWGEIANVEGTFTFSVKVTDAVGTTAEQSITVHVTAQAPDSVTAELPWLFADDHGIKAGGELQVVSPAEWTVRFGAGFSLSLNAVGGVPFKFTKNQKGKPGVGRYWEFSRNTLKTAVLVDNVSFGALGTALPSTKKHHPSSGRVGRIITWWDYKDFGKSEDASRHLNMLRSKGLIRSAPLVAKPERLMQKLLELLAPRARSRVLCIGDNTASMASVCVKTGRQALVLTSDASSSLEIWNDCGLPRLQAVLAEKDDGGISGEVPKEDKTLGEILSIEVGEPLFFQDRRDGFLTQNVDDYRIEEDRLVEAVGSLAGFFMDPGSTRQGYNLDGASCDILSPSVPLNNVHLRDPKRQRETFAHTVLYESTSLDDEELAKSGLTLLRYPEDLVGRKT